jgi:hypothetical protein
MTEERLVELETRLAYQDQLVEELNKLVFWYLSRTNVFASWKRYAKI